VPFLVCNYLRNCYLQSCTELRILLGHDIHQAVMRMRTGHVQRWNMSRIANYGVGDFKAL